MPTDTFFPDTHYHVCHHANSEELLFRSDENYRYLLRLTVKYICPVANVLAYCLMPNHFHLLIRTCGLETLQDKMRQKPKTESPDSFLIQQFSNLCNAYSKAFNRLYNRRGALFRRTLQRKHITNDRQLLNTLIYIHQNPVHHGFTPNWEDWQYSSVHNYLTEKPGNVSTKDIYQKIGTKLEFRKMHEEFALADLQEDLLEV